MDGYGKPDAHHERAAELEMNALAATEHGNTSSHVQHEKAGKKYGVKPIFGLEAYTAPADMRETKNQRKWHLTVLAADQAGYTNLNEVVRRSWAEGFYRWPTVTGDILQDHHKGLIILSGCADSLLACTMLGGKGIPEPDGDDGLKAAYKVAGKFKSLLGDRYYLECQQFPELPRSNEINTRYAKMSKDLGIPLVATADCHYPRPDDNEMQKVLHAAGRNTGTVAAAEAEWEYDIRLTLPTSDDFITKRLMQTGLSKSQAQQAVENTALIADRCNVVLPKSETIRYPLPAGYIDSKALIWDWLRRGWKYRWERNAHMRKNKQAYLDRMQYEMDLVELKGYMDYFLMLSDAVSWAKDNGIPVGPARGSAAASLVCYLLRITEVDPMQFPTMMFERFIDAKRED
jgi:DNA polymerase-3 subunit alpha